MANADAMFYVLDSNRNLVPAKFLTGLDGAYVGNPNSTINTVSSKSNLYFDANGNKLLNANVNNYLVVPVDYSLERAINFSDDVSMAAFDGKLLNESY